MEKFDLKQEQPEGGLEKERALIDRAMSPETVRRRLRALKEE